MVYMAVDAFIPIIIIVGRQVLKVTKTIGTQEGNTERTNSQST